MAERTIIIHYNEEIELVNVPYLSVYSVSDLFDYVWQRIFERYPDLRTDLSDCLCDGPYASQPISDQRLYEINQMLQQTLDPYNLNDNCGIQPVPLHLWLCNRTNNGFLTDGTLITNEQRMMANTEAVCIEDHFQSRNNELNSENMVFGAMNSSSQAFNPLDPNDSDALHTTDFNVEEFLKNLTESDNTATTSRNDDDRKFIDNFRSKQKKQYRTDIFPLNKPKKNKIKQQGSKPKKKTKTNKKCKPKVNTTTRKYAFHLQSVNTKPGCKRISYPKVQLPQRYHDLIKAGKTVMVYIAAVKRRNNCLYIDALKGFLMDKKNRKVPLENPFVLELSSAKKNVSPDGHYTLKLALIQVCSDLARQCTVEFNENFNLNERTVDEKPQDSSDDTTVTDAESEEFQIAIVLGTAGEPRTADWSTIIKSNFMSYKIYELKANKNAEGSNEKQVQSIQEEDGEEECDDDVDDNDD
ncbi:hypothetical protein I4U23_026581 [Adineta vaga]|nr:hypothetical protein I4U23_026581 [Adineta vaga]